MTNIVNVTPENAQSTLFESAGKLVAVYFWSSQAPQCEVMGATLESIAQQYEAAMVLAKINCDEEPALPAQFGVQSVPTLILAKDGQTLDGFSGDKTDQELRALLDTHLPKPWEAQLLEGKALLEQEDYSAAAALLKMAYTDSAERADIGVQYALALIGLRRLDEAQALLDKVTMVDQDAEFARANAQLELAREAGKSPAIEALEQQLKDSPDDENLALQLAVQYSQNAYTQEALDLLLGLLQRSLGSADGNAKKAYTDILSSLDKADPLAVTYQRKLYTLLY